MTRITIATALPLAVLLFCGGPSHVLAQGNTKIVIKDGDSLLMTADGRDAGKTWKVTSKEMRHVNETGVLSGLEIVGGPTVLCGSPQTCGADPAKSWTIEVTYGTRSLTIASIGSEKGLHLTHRGLPFDQWQPTANPDERVFGHGDGKRITGIKVNHTAYSCLSHRCQITLTYPLQ